MSLLNVKKAFNDIVAKPSKEAGPQRARTTTAFATILDRDHYQTKTSNWFRAMPYGFRFRDRRTGQDQILFLPISPQNLTIVTHYATNVITTLYGTVEEHSEQRYFDIQIEGTTGIAPRYTLPIDKKSINSLKSMTSDGRSSYGDGNGSRLSINANLAGGFFSQTIGVVNRILGNAQDLLNGKESMNVTGIENENNTGYAAFHRLYKLFLHYKADASGVSPRGAVNLNPRVINREDNSAHPLAFLNYKDNNAYDCVIQNFVLKRSASNPMLYNYSISLRAYNLRTIDAIKADIGGYKDRLANLGLNGIQSNTLLSSVTDTSKSVKQFAGAFLGGINILGR